VRGLVLARLLPLLGLVSLVCNLFDGMQERNAGTGGGAAARGEDLFVVAGFGNFPARN
jgi:hypothetical protein